MNRMPALIVLLFIACLLAFSCTPVRSEGVDMVEMVGQPAELRFTLEITRAATGTWQMAPLLALARRCQARQTACTSSHRTALWSALAQR